MLLPHIDTGKAKLCCLTEFHYWECFFFVPFFGIGCEDLGGEISRHIAKSRLFFR